MKLLYLLLLVPIILEFSSAHPVTTIDQYGRVYYLRGRMAPVTPEESPEAPVEKPVPEYQQLDDDDDDEDDDDDDVDDDDESGGIYPPDFAKLFPNPDGRPVGPDSYDSYQKHHPASYQPNKPGHGPAASPGPAASRGPVAQHRPPNHQGGGPSPGYAQYDKPAPGNRRQYNRPPPGPPPQDDAPAPPPRRQYSRPPPGPPPQEDGPPEYRTENMLDESEEVPRGRQLYYVGTPRQMGPVYNRNMYYNTNRRNYQQYVPSRRYTKPSSYRVVPQMVRAPMVRTQMTRTPMTRTPMTRTPMFQQGYAVASPKTWSMKPMVRGPVATPPVVGRTRYGRDYPRTSPFSRYSVHSDYNPEYIINPTAMLSRRRFRYHHSQRVPNQRIPIYPGYWENPWVGHHFQRE